MRLKSLGVTVLLVEETALFKRSQERQVAELSALNENLIFMRHQVKGAEIKRTVSILKIRNATYDPTIREFIIGKKGIVVDQPLAAQTKWKLCSLWTTNMTS